MELTEITDILREVYLFEALDEVKIKALASISTVKSYSKESELFLEGEFSKNLLILIEGSVKICKHNDKGLKINIGFFDPYSLLAEAATLRGTVLPSSAYCQTDVKIICIEVETFIKKFIGDPNISYAIIRSLLEKVQLLQTNIHMNIATTARDKILTFYRNNESLNLEMKNYEIASLLGMNSATFSRNITQLYEEGRVLKNGSKYKIVK